MIANHIETILYVTGAITAGAAVLSIAPRLLLRTLSGVDIEDPNALMMIRHWAWLVGITGVLLVYAGTAPAVREAVMTAAIASKAVFALLVISRAGTPFGRALLPVAVFDVICAVLYSWYFIVT